MVPVGILLISRHRLQCWDVLYVDVCGSEQLRGRALLSRGRVVAEHLRSRQLRRNVYSQLRNFHLFGCLQRLGWILLPAGLDRIERRAVSGDVLLHRRGVQGFVQVPLLLCCVCVCVRARVTSGVGWSQRGWAVVPEWDFDGGRRRVRRRVLWNCRRRLRLLERELRRVVHGTARKCLRRAVHGLIGRALRRGGILCRRVGRARKLRLRSRDAVCRGLRLARLHSVPRGQRLLRRHRRSSGLRCCCGCLLSRVVVCAGGRALLAWVLVRGGYGARGCVAKKRVVCVCGGGGGGGQMSHNSFTGVFPSTIASMRELTVLNAVCGTAVNAAGGCVLCALTCETILRLCSCICRTITRSVGRCPPQSRVSNPCLSCACRTTRCARGCVIDVMRVGGSRGAPLMNFSRIVPHAERSEYS